METARAHEKKARNYRVIAENKINDAGEILDMADNAIEKSTRALRELLGEG